MKNKLRSIFKYVAISSFVMSSCLPASAQSSIVLDQNNVSAPLSDDGTFFTDLGSSSAGYEVPKGGGVSAIYQLGFLYGGVDVNGQLKMAIGPSGGDLFPGPATVGAATGATPGQWPSSFAAVSRDEIELHIQKIELSGNIQYIPRENLIEIIDRFKNRIDFKRTYAICISNKLRRFLCFLPD